jgi:hypothetical protein
MKYVLTVFAVISAAFAARHPAHAQSSSAKRDDPLAVIAASDRMASQNLWPGFDPRTIPVAIFDGERTFLFRHPAPPSGFATLPGAPGVLVMKGRVERTAAQR